MTTFKTRIAFIALGLCVTLHGMAEGGDDIDLIQHPSTIHTSSGGATPEEAYDGDFDTDHHAGFRNKDGGYSVTITNEHEFAVPSTINTILFKMRAWSFATGCYIREHNGYYVIEYKAGADWVVVPGSHRDYSGGDGESTIYSGEKTLSGLNLTDVTHVRAKAHAFGNATGGESNVGGDVSIFEIQAYGVFEGASLRVSVINDLWGSVQVEPNLPAYSQGSSVTLTATPVEGREFGYWEIYDPNYPGDANCAALDSNLTTTIVMMADRDVTAVFECGDSPGHFLPMMLFPLGLFAAVRRRH
ncbi:MAG: hypothetical protein JXQ73_03090 [Phycisphaerae bacterium]|nr:hypothetical protein [Phycisphaerae bacterium]